MPPLEGRALDGSYVPSYQPLLTFCRRSTCYDHKFLICHALGCFLLQLFGFYVLGGVHLSIYASIHLGYALLTGCGSVLTLLLHTWWSICIGARTILLEQVRLHLVPQDTLYVPFLHCNSSLYAKATIPPQAQPFLNPVLMPGALFWLEWT